MYEYYYCIKLTMVFSWTKIIKKQVSPSGAEGITVTDGDALKEVIKNYWMPACIP